VTNKASSKANNSNLELENKSSFDMPANISKVALSVLLGSCGSSSAHDSRGTEECRANLLPSAGEDPNFILFWLLWLLPNNRLFISRTCAFTSLVNISEGSSLGPGRNFFASKNIFS
jgi:hypothetical protein